MKLVMDDVIGKRENSVAVIWLCVRFIGDRVDAYTRTFYKSTGADTGYTYVGSYEPFNGISALEMLKTDAKYRKNFVLND